MCCNMWKRLRRNVFLFLFCKCSSKFDLFISVRVCVCVCDRDRRPIHGWIIIRLRREHGFCKRSHKVIVFSIYLINFISTSVSFKQRIVWFYILFRAGEILWKQICKRAFRKLENGNYKKIIEVSGTWNLNKTNTNTTYSNCHWYNVQKKSQLSIQYHGFVLLSLFLTLFRLFGY